jgi:hypothetical protein
LPISNVDEEIDETKDFGKKKSTIIKLMRFFTFTEIILSLDVKISSGKVTFNIIKGCKTRDYPDRNGAFAWERLKNKCKLFLRLQW